jgi:alanine-glyoxylate transaminase / serine-glyoxylate transaminase / serine-pyruvate transaminase
MTNDLSDLNVPYRLLLGPGPSLVHPRVYRAMTQPVIGMFDPVFIQLLDDTQRPLRTVFRTENDFTMAISGTGTAGMEAAIYNVVEPGDSVVVCRNGYFGMRMSEMVERCGATVVPVEAPWGSIIDPQQVEVALKEGGRVKVVAIVHGETSTGVLQPLEEISRIAHEHGALLLADAVTSLSGCELRIDDWGIDVCYSGTQKCLSAPPGMAPLTMSAQAMEVVANRREPPRSWYVDLTMLGRYWGGGTTTRAYHHTPPMTMLYALREGLRIVLEEGLEPRIVRHLRNARAFWAGIEAMGLALHVEEKHRLPPLTTVRVPEGIDEMAVRTGLLLEHNIEVGRGFGALEGQVWRVGLMGYGSSEENVLALLYALETQLAKQEFGLDRGAGVAAAARALSDAA